MINECQLVPHSVKMFKHGFRKKKIWTAKLDSLKKCEGPKLFDASFLNLNKLGVTIWYPRPYLPYEVLWAYCHTQTDNKYEMLELPLHLIIHMLETFLPIEKYFYDQIFFITIVLLYEKKPQIVLRCTIIICSVSIFCYQDPIKIRSILNLHLYVYVMNHNFPYFYKYIRETILLFPNMGSSTLLLSNWKKWAP